MMNAGAGTDERASLKLREKELQSSSKEAQLLFKAAKKATPSRLVCVPVVHEEVWAESFICQLVVLVRC